LSSPEIFVHFLRWYAASLKESYDTGCNVGKNDEYEETYLLEKMGWGEVGKADEITALINLYFCF